ncbi:MAG: Rieske (2Fe-2S) protein [Actinomycetes bacterium]
MEKYSRRAVVAGISALLTSIGSSQAFGATKPKPIPKKKIVKPKPKSTPTPTPSAKTTPSAKPSPSATAATSSSAAIQVNNKPLLLSELKIGDSVNAQYIHPTNNSKHEIVVHRSNETTTVAFTAICTHQGCTVDANAKSFDCPCHGSSYDSSTGAVLNGPATRSLAGIPVTEKDGALFLTIS